MSMCAIESCVESVNMIFLFYMCNNVMCTIVFSYFHFLHVCNNTCRQSGMLAREAVGKMCANEAFDNRECRQTGPPYERI